MSKLYGKLIELIDLVTDYSPARERKKRLEHARLTLIEHECQKEFYSATVSMLKKRIERMEAEEKAAPVELKSVQMRAPVLPHNPLSFRRQQS